MKLTGGQGTVNPPQPPAVDQGALVAVEVVPTMRMMPILPIFDMPMVRSPGDVPVIVIVVLRVHDRLRNAVGASASAA